MLWVMILVLWTLLMQPRVPQPADVAGNVVGNCDLSWVQSSWMCVARGWSTDSPRSTRIGCSAHRPHNRGISRCSRSSPFQDTLGCSRQMRTLQHPNLHSDPPNALISLQPLGTLTSANKASPDSPPPQISGTDFTSIWFLKPGSWVGSLQALPSETLHICNCPPC